MAKTKLEIESDYGPVVQTFNAINKEIDFTQENVVDLGKSGKNAFDSMTNEAKQFGKQVSGNVQDFTKLKAATREQVQTIQQLIAARKASNDPTQIANYNKKIDEARQKIKALHAEQNKGAKENQEQSKKSIGLITQLIDKQRKLTEARDRSNDPKLIQKYNSLIDQTKNKLNDLTTTQKKASSSSIFSGGIGAVLGGNLLFTGIQKVKQAFTDAIDVQVQFQQSLQNLSAITGASGSDLVFYGEEAIKMGRNIKGGATAAVEAFKLIGSAKPELLSNKEALVEVTEAAVTLSQASGLTLPEAAQNLGTALNAFEEPAANAGKLINVLSAASKVGAQEIPFVTDALSKFGGVAKNAGVSIEESAAAIEILGAKIPEASIVGTNLRGVMIVLQTEAAKQGRAFKGLGAELELLAPKVKDIAFLEQTFGKENLLAAQTLISQREELAKMTKEVTGTSDALVQAAINTNTLAQSITEAGNAYDEFLLALSTGAVGDIFKNVMEGLTQTLLDFSSVLRGTFASDENIQAMVQFGNVTESQAKKLDQLGLSIENLNEISKSEKETIDYLKATDIYLNNINSAEGAARVLNNLGLEVKKLGAFYDAGTITIEEYTIRLKILQAQINKGIEINKKIASANPVAKAMIEEIGLIEKLQQEIQQLTDLRVKAKSEGEINKINSEIKSKQAELDRLLGKANDDIKRAKEEFERAVADLKKKTASARLDALGGQERIDAELKFNEEELQITKDHFVKLGKAVNKNFELTLQQQNQFNELSLQLQRKAAEESIKIEIDKQAAMAAQINQGNQLNLAGLNAEEQGQINAVNGTSQPSGVSAVAFEEEKQKQLLNIQLYYTVQRAELEKKALADQRNAELKAFDLQLQQIGNGDDQITQEKRAAIDRDVALMEQKYQIEGEVIKNKVDQTINEINAKKDALSKSKPFSLQELFGLSDAEVQGLQTAVAQVTELFNAFYELQFELVNQEIQLSQSKIDKYNEEIQTLENKLTREIELNSEGKANNIDKLNAEIALKEEQKKKEEAVEKAALEKRKKLQKEKLNLDTVLQASNLAVAATQIFAATAGGGPVGVALAIVAIGAMLGAFIITKQKAYAAINSSENTEGFKEGVIALNGPGTETSDSINARLSKGESVITAKKTKENRNLLEGIHNEDKGLMKAGILDLIKNTGIRLSDDLPEVINTKKEIVKQNEINAYLKTDNSKLEKEVKEMKEIMNEILSENKLKNYSDQNGNLVIKKGSHKEIFKK